MGLTVAVSITAAAAPPLHKVHGGDQVQGAWNPLQHPLVSSTSGINFSEFDVARVVLNARECLQKSVYRKGVRCQALGTPQYLFFFGFVG